MIEGSVYRSLRLRAAKLEADNKINPIDRFYFNFKKPLWKKKKKVVAQMINHVIFLNLLFSLN